MRNPLAHKRRQDVLFAKERHRNNPILIRLALKVLKKKELYLIVVGALKIAKGGADDNGRPAYGCLFHATTSVSSESPARLYPHAQAFDELLHKSALALRKVLARLYRAHKALDDFFKTILVTCSGKRDVF